MAYVYIIRNTVNDKVYVGCSINKPESRFKQHLKPSSLTTRNYKLQQAIKELGKDKFYVELLEEVNDEERYDKEIYYIKKYNSYKEGYNSTPGGKGGKIFVDEDDIQYLITQYNECHDLNYLAAKYHVNKCTITRLFKSLGVEVKYGNIISNGTFKARDHIRCFDSEEKQQLLVNKYYEGYTYNELSKMFDVDQRTINRELTRLNVTRRGRGNARKPIKV